MAIPLQDQYNQATGQTDFRSKVAAALTGVAISAFSAPPNLDATVQKKRILMARTLLNNVDSYLTPFAWFVITRPGLSTVDDVTDPFITTTITGGFDTAASLLVADAQVGSG